MESHYLTKSRKKKSQIFLFFKNFSEREFWFGMLNFISHNFTTTTSKIMPVRFEEDRVHAELTNTSSEVGENFRTPSVKCSNSNSKIENIHKFCFNFFFIFAERIFFFFFWLVIGLVGEKCWKGDLKIL